MYHCINTAYDSVKSFGSCNCIDKHSSNPRSGSSFTTQNTLVNIVLLWTKSEKVCI
jgi:hypothetical protein